MLRPRARARLLGRWLCSRASAFRAAQASPARPRRDAIWRSGDLEIWRSGDLEIWRSGDLEIWRNPFFENLRTPPRSGDRGLNDPPDHSAYCPIEPAIW